MTQNRMKTITQRELLQLTGEILRQAEEGHRFTVTIGGRPVAELGPYRKRQWVPKAELLALLRPQALDPTFFDDSRTLGGTVEELEDP